MPVESTIICEGYYDRAFWTGCLLVAGCKNARFQSDGTPVPGGVRDLANRPVKGGQFGFWTTTGNFVRVVPCNGKSRILPETRKRLNDRHADPFKRLVLNIDPDVLPGQVATGLQLQDVEGILKSFDPNLTTDADDNILLDQGTFIVNLIRWEAAEQPSPKLPDKQCLERLVCASLQTVYPDRTDPVFAWLASRPGVPTPDPKEHVWSHMAGWYAERGCESFFQALWEDPRIADELKKRLQANSAWKVVEALAI